MKKWFFIILMQCLYGFVLAKEHPCLLFSPADVQPGGFLYERIQSGTPQSEYIALLTHCNTLLPASYRINPNHSYQDLDPASYSNKEQYQIDVGNRAIYWTQPLHKDCEDLGFAYQLSGNANYGNKAIALCFNDEEVWRQGDPTYRDGLRWYHEGYLQDPNYNNPYWQDPINNQNYPWGPHFGYANTRIWTCYTLAYVFTYDYCYDLLTDSERATFRKQIKELLDRLCETDICTWRAEGNLDVMVTAAIGLAALVIDDEEVDGTSYDATQTINDIVKPRAEAWVSRGLSNEGVGHEGWFYTNFTLVWILPLIEALKRYDGTDLYHSGHLEKLSKWIAYEILPGAQKINNRYSGFTPALIFGYSWLAGEYKDRIAAFIFNELWTGSSHKYWTAYQRSGIILKHDDGVIPVTDPTEIIPVTQYFEEARLAYFRTGWEPGWIGTDTSKIDSVAWLTSKYPLEHVCRRPPPETYKDSTRWWDWWYRLVERYDGDGNMDMGYETPSDPTDDLDPNNPIKYWGMWNQPNIWRF